MRRVPAEKRTLVPGVLVTRILVVALGTAAIAAAAVVFRARSGAPGGAGPEHSESPAAAEAPAVPEAPLADAPRGTPPSGPGSQVGAAPAGFVNVAPSRGLTRSNVSGSPGLLWIFENIGSGAALLDYDGDGRLDAYINNAGTTEILPGPPKRLRLVKGPGATLYRQLPDGRFEDATERAGVSFDGWGTGVAVGDVENDGDLDLFLGAYGTPRLFVNLGDGTFRDATASAGLERPGYSTSAAFVDHDRDGDLDLYVVQYVVFDTDDLPNRGDLCYQDDVIISCGPTMHPHMPDIFYRNRGDGTFEDITAEAGMSRQPGAYGLGVAAGDLDRDGWPDIYVTNDTQANFLWRNEGDGTFQELALLSGVALSETAQGQSGMGVDFGDVDGDGWLDIQVSNYSEEANAFYRNLGDGTFEDRSASSGIARATFMLLLWGTKLFDIDHDADLDLVLVGGHVHPRAAELAPHLSFEQRILACLGDGTGKFTDASAKLGLDLLVRRNHRGLAVGDVDGDGDLDMLVTLLDGPPILLENSVPKLGNSIQFVLEGATSNREGIGARIEVVSGGKRQVREVTRGGSYLSGSDAAAHFGLGAAERCDVVEVLWPSGGSSRLEGLAAGRLWRIREADGAVSEVRTFRPE